MLGNVLKCVITLQHHFCNAVTLGNAVGDEEMLGDVVMFVLRSVITI